MRFFTTLAVLFVAVPVLGGCGSSPANAMAGSYDGTFAFAFTSTDGVSHALSQDATAVNVDALDDGHVQVSFLGDIPCTLEGSLAGDDVSFASQILYCDATDGATVFTLETASGTATRVGTTLTVNLSGEYSNADSGETGTFTATYIGEFIEGTAP